MDRKLKISNFWDVQNCPMVCFGLSIKYAFFISWVIGRSWCEFIKILPYLRSGNVVLICCFSLRTLITFPCLVWCRKSFWTIARSAHRKMIWIIQKQGTQNKYMTWRHIMRQLYQIYALLIKSPEPEVLNPWLGYSANSCAPQNAVLLYKTSAPAPNFP